jgi:hypothetical protein
MDCRQARKLMSPYMDSELGATRTYEVSAHLRHCDDCTRRFEAESRVDKAVRARMERESMPPAMWGAIVDRVTHADARPRDDRPFLARGHIRFAIAAGILLGVGLTAWPPWAQFEFGSDEPQIPWLVDALEVAAPDHMAFAGDEDRAPQAQQLIDQFGLQLAVAPSATSVRSARHDAIVVDARQCMDDQGRQYVEIRMNCCEQPVLMVIGRRCRSSGLATACGGVDCDGGAHHKNFDGVRFGGVRFGSTSVAVASRHPIDGVLRMIQDRQN